MHIRVAWVVLFGLVLGVPAIAWAGPIESPGDFDAGRDDPDKRAIRYDFSGGGLLLSDDGGDNYRLLCNKFIDSSVTRETTGLVVGPGGLLFTGEYSGLWRGDADGCSWSKVPELAERWVTDVVHDPVDPQVLYAVTGGGAEAADNGIYRYDAAADTWTPMGEFDDTPIRNLRVVATDNGLRFVQGFARGQDAEGRANYFLRYSDDGGVQWTEYAFPVTDGSMRLSDVDPADPDRLLISVSYRGDPGDDEVWLGDATAESEGFVRVGSPATFGGAAFGADGTVWFGDQEGALMRLDAGAGDAVEVGDSLRPRCVAYGRLGESLHICRLLDFGRVDAASGDYTLEVDFRELDSWQRCDGADVPGACEADLGNEGWCGVTHYPEAPICEDYGYPGRMEGGDGDGDMAGQPDAGDGDGDSGGDLDSGGCGCRVLAADVASRRAFEPGPPVPLALLGLCGLLWVRARRRGQR